jgi:hypothetical protein
MLLRSRPSTLLLGALAALALPTCWRSHGRALARAELRACHANQKTLSGAVEMYQLDF